VRTRFSLLFVLFSIFLLIVACSSPSGTSEVVDTEESTIKEQGEEDGKEKVLNLLLPNFNNESEQAQWERVIEVFENANPDISVQYSTDVTRVQDGKLVATLQSGTNIPDVILADGSVSGITFLANAGLIDPMGDLYDKNGWKDQIVPFAYDYATQTMNDTYMLPHVIDIFGVYYHRDILENYGITSMETLEEFENALQTIKEAGQVPIKIGGRTAFTVTWVHSPLMNAVAGSEVMKNILFGDGDWTHPKIVEATKTLERWIKNEYISADSISLELGDAIQQFFAKQYPIAFLGTYQIADFETRDMDVEYLTLPAASDDINVSPTAGIGKAWVIPSDAENKDLAEIWLNFTLTYEFNEPLLNDPKYSFVNASKSFIENESVGKLLEQLKDDVRSGLGYNPGSFMPPEVSEPWLPSLQGLVGGMLTADEVIANIQEAWEKR